MRVRELERSGWVPTLVGLAVSTFNQPITAGLEKGALDAFERAGVGEVLVGRVSGALELGVVALELFERGCEAVVCVGAVIQGETDHYLHVSTEASRAITEVSLRVGRLVGNAVLTVREYEQAVDRSRPGAGNKGFEAAEAVLRVLAVMKTGNET